MADNGWSGGFSWLPHHPPTRPILSEDGQECNAEYSQYAIQETSSCDQSRHNDSVFVAIGAPPILRSLDPRPSSKHRRESDQDGSSLFHYSRFFSAGSMVFLQRKKSREEKKSKKKQKEKKEKKD